MNTITKTDLRRLNAHIEQTWLRKVAEQRKAGLSLIEKAIVLLVKRLKSEMRRWPLEALASEENSELPMIIEEELLGGLKNLERFKMKSGWFICKLLVLLPVKRGNDKDKEDLKRCSV